MKPTDIPMTNEEEATWKIIEPHWGKGSVEWLMKHLIRFEGRLKLRRPRDLDELNDCGLDWGIMILLRTARVQQTSLPARRVLVRRRNPERGGDVLKGGYMKQTDIPMTHEEEAIWKIIEPHRGKGSEILGTTIAERTMNSYTRVREVIAHLVTTHGKLIGSNSRGYYVAVTPAEVNEITKSLRHRGIMILLRAARVQQTSLVEVWNQSYLEFGDELRRDR